jgi:enoyl-CoA hydratase
MHEELAHVFRAAQHDAGDVFVLTGTARAFCAGGDVDWFQEMIDTPDKFSSIGADAKAIVMGLLELDKPIISAVNGPAAGLGASIALLCDVVMISDAAKIGDPHVAMGLVAGDGGALIWPQLIGFNRAKEYLMTGDMIPAEEAYRLGLVNHVIPADALMERAYALAERLGNGASQSINWTKTIVNMPLRQIAVQAMEAAMGYEALTNLSDDHQEAVHAFREKRPAKFTGK